MSERLYHTDTPLIFFSFASVFAFWLGIARRSPGWQALAGVFLGLAFLSKYFAVLLGLAYVAMLRSPRAAGATGARLRSSFCVRFRSPWSNLWWNYEHCWAN